MSVFFYHDKFIQSNWNYNIDKFFFIVMTGFVYATLKMMYLGIDTIPTFLVVIRMFVSPFTVIGLILIVEGLLSVCFKIALNPGIILESKFKVFSIFFKTIAASGLSLLKFKPVFYKNCIVVSKLENKYTLRLSADGIISKVGNVDNGYVLKHSVNKQLPNHLQF